MKNFFDGFYCGVLNDILGLARFLNIKIAFCCLLLIVFEIFVVFVKDFPCPLP